MSEQIVKSVKIRPVSSKSGIVGFASATMLVPVTIHNIPIWQNQTGLNVSDPVTINKKPNNKGEIQTYRNVNAECENQVHKAMMFEAIISSYKKLLAEAAGKPEEQTEMAVDTKTA